MRTLVLFLSLVGATLGRTQAFTKVFEQQAVNSSFQAVAVDGGRNIYLAGVENEQFFAQRLDQNGNQIWKTVLTVPNAVGVDTLIVDADGNIHFSARTDIVAGTAKMFLASFDHTNGNIRYTKSIPNISSDLAITRISAGKAGNSVLLFATATFAGSATGKDVLALRINPGTGAEIWRRQIDGGASLEDLAIGLVVNSSGAPFLNTRLRRPTGNVGSIIRLSGSDGSTIFQRDLGFGAPGNGLVAIKGTNNLGFLSSGGSFSGTIVALVNSSTGAVIRESTVPFSAAGAFSASNGDMIAGLLIPDGYALRMDGTTGVFDIKNVGAQVQSLLCADLNDQMFHLALVLGGSGVKRIPSGFGFDPGFFVTRGVVDNQNNLILMGSSGGISNVAKFIQNLETANDNFTAQFSNSLQIKAPGVLANDTVLGGTLTVDQAPNKGSVVLNQDGSFTYTPNASFDGNDSFRYQVDQAGNLSSATVAINKTTLQSITLGASSIVGGQPALATLTMSKRPTVGLEALISDNSTAVTLPSSVVVDTLATTTQFNISSIPVSAPINVIITATVGDVTKQANLLVKPGGLKALTLTGSTNMVAGETRSLKVELTGAAASTTTVQLSGSGPEASFPASAVIVAGLSARSVNLGVAQRTTPATFTLTASLFLVTKTLTLNIAPMPKIITLQGPDTVVGGLDANMVVTLDKETPFFLSVLLELIQNPGGVATLPGSSFIAPGNSAATFAVRTAVVTAPKVFTLRASVGGASKTRNVQVIPNPLDSIVVAPNPVTGGQPVAVTVNLSNLAPPGGITIQLSSNSSLVTVPASVTVPAGSWAGTVAATTKPVVFAGRVTLTAKLGAVTKTVQLFLNP
ncbi:MAG: Ig-like domain-containing protein [Fimbriimonadaceae bacterium]